MEPDPEAELSSLASQLDELIGRVGTILGGMEQGDRADGQSALLEVERHLVGARRELERRTRQTVDDGQ
ncbi:MAG: hypothetical protein QF896_04470 [Acidimicrobiales bacterium]|nr:hypothetical protein [Acidimicrobiales bacterium]